MNSKESSLQLQPIAMLMDELKSQDISIRIQSIRRLKTISLALGSTRTKLELLPFLQTYLDEEDEILAALAEELIEIYEILKDNSILPLYESLLGAEEPIIIDNCIKSISLIVDDCKKSNNYAVINEIVEMIKRLATGDWFTKRCSAVELLCIVYGNVEEDSLKLEVSEIFSSCSKDDSPLVRKAVANNIHSLVDFPECFKDLKQIVSLLASDPQDTIRLLVPEPLSLLLISGFKASGPEQIHSLDDLKDIFMLLAGDSSWRVRYMVASSYSNFASVYRDHETFLSFLNDEEPEVKKSACSQLSLVCPHFSTEINQNQILPSLVSIVTDYSEDVRASLALQLNDLANVVSKELTLSDILPLIIQMLGDENSSVRINVISKLGIIVDVIGIAQLTNSLLPAIIILSKDPQWRVRQTIIEYIPELSQHLGEPFFKKNLLKLLLSWLDDPVYQVRLSTTVAISRVISHFIDVWLNESLNEESGLFQLLDGIVEFTKHRNYLRRIISMELISKAFPLLPLNLNMQYLIPCLETLCQDQTPNVKIAAAKTLNNLTDISDVDVKKTICNLLQRLQADEDSDVSWFAKNQNISIESTQFT